MKVRITTYSLTLCLVSTAVILIYFDLRVSPDDQNTNYLNRIQAAIGQNKVTINKISNQHGLQEYSPKPIPLRLQSRQKAGAVESTTTTTDTPLEEPELLSSAHIVAVVSYMRSGSSLTADILQHFHGTVYVFEPLHTVARRVIEGKPLIYLDGKRTMLKPENLTDDFITAELHKWFQCRYGDLDIHSLVDGFHHQFSRSMRLLIECWKMKHRTLKAMRQCLPDAIKMCQNAKQRLFKFIRLPMRIIQNVFNLYPNLQVIHLIRDPRGSLTSQIKLNKSSWEDIATTSKAHCDRVSEDLNITVNLHYHDNNRAKILVYERLAEDPINTAKRIYNYIGMPVMKYVMDYIRKLTLEGRRRSCLYCIVRGNSTKTAYSWRDVIRYQDMVAIDNNCPLVYDYLGYQRFHNRADLRDHNLDTIFSPNVPILI